MVKRVDHTKPSEEIGLHCEFIEIPSDIMLAAEQCWNEMGFINDRLNQVPVLALHLLAMRDRYRSEACKSQTQANANGNSDARTDTEKDGSGSENRRREKIDELLIVVLVHSVLQPAFAQAIERIRNAFISTTPQPAPKHNSAREFLDELRSLSVRHGYSLRARRITWLRDTQSTNPTRNIAAAQHPYHLPFLTEEEVERAADAIRGELEVWSGAPEANTRDILKYAVRAAFPRKGGAA